MKKLLYPALVALWLLVLAGFTSTWAWVLLSVLGAGLAKGGFSMAREAIPVMREGIQYFAVFVLGILLLFGALATLSPGLPGSWLATTSTGWSLLEKRSKRLETAIKAGETGLAARLASRGLGTSTPIDKFGRPLLFDATDGEMVRALVSAGLSPDVADSDGRTLLMSSYDDEIVAALLEARAQPDIRDAEGRTALTYAVKKSPDQVALLLRAGANVYAEDDAGITIADVFPAAGPLRELLEQHAGAGNLPPPRTITAIDRGRRDWLSPADALLRPSTLTLNPEFLNYGDQATLDIVLSNDSSRDRLLEVTAALGGSAYFVGASHDGRVRTPGIIGLSQSIRWPMLTLPAGRNGNLRLDIVVVNDLEAGDFSVDLRSRSLAEVDTVTQVQTGVSTEETILTVNHTPGDPLEKSGEFYWLSALVSFGFVAILYLAIRALMRARRGEPEAVALVVSKLCAVTLFLLAVFFISDLAEPWATFEETECEILDRRIRLEEAIRSTGRTSRQSSQPFPQPNAAVGYSMHGQKVVTTGFAAGIATRSVNDFRSFPLGATVPCWVDPAQPNRFTLDRQPNAAAIVGLVLLLSVASVLSLVARKLRVGS